MKLEDYLELLGSCPEADLHTELGVYDNFSILLAADFSKVVEHFRQSARYQYVEGPNLVAGWNTYMFRSVDHLVTLFPTDGVPPISTTCGIPDSGLLRDEVRTHIPEEVLEHTERQRKSYRVSISLHGESSRSFANVIDDIGRFAIQERIALCLPHSYSEKHGSLILTTGSRPLDCSRIVYYEPPK